MCVVIGVSKVDVENIIKNVTEEVIGDTPVSVQLATALRGMSRKEDVDTLRAEVIALRKEIERLADLIGDMSVSEQINMFINRHEN